LSITSEWYELDSVVWYNRWARLTT
jgi:hypothetical protein